MHELPQDLSSSLRSFRGSVYGKSSKAQQVDLEKAAARNEARATQSSLILSKHPTKSKHALRRQDKNLAAMPPLDPILTEQPIEKPGHDQETPGKTGLFSAAPHIRDPDPAADRLDDNDSPLRPEHFFELIGLRPSADSHGQVPKGIATKDGMYGRIRHSYRYINYKYRIFDVLIYVFLVLQVILSAVFIALGALTSLDAHIAIIVLGAVSTVIAGVLALMKGQGLPNRLRQTRDSLRYVLFEAEELYWDVLAGHAVMFRDVRKVREDYLRVMEEARRNHPDAWNPTALGIAQGVKQGRGAGPPKVG